MFPTITTKRRRAVPARTARSIAVALFALALLMLGATAAAAAPGSLRVVDRSPTLGERIQIVTPDGGWFTEDPGRQVVRITPSTGAPFDTVAWCVDTTRRIVAGVDFPVDLQSAGDVPELGDARHSEAAWLMTRADDLIGVASNPGLEAASIQIAIWQLTGQAKDARSVTAIESINQRVAQLRAFARGRTVATTIALSGPSAPLTPGATATLTVSGSPDAVVDLAVASGAATLSASQVTLDGNGLAQVAVTAGAAGDVRITASAGAGILWRAAHRGDANYPQDMAYVVPTTVGAEVSFTVAAVPAQPVTPVGVAPALAGRPAPVRAALRVSKTAPARITAGRLIGYTLTVTNVSRRVARSVVLRDRIPAGTLLGSLPARARLDRGSVVWRLGTLKPGARVTVKLWLRTAPTASRTVRNVAVASASNAATVRARARTLVRPVRVAPVVQPAVTG